MSIPNRIFRISKAYLNQVRERIDSELSERELDAGIGGDTPAASSGSDRGYRSPEPRSVDPAVSAADEMMRRAEERIAAARRDMESRGELDTPISQTSTSSSGTTSTPSSSSTTSSSSSASAAVSTDPNASDYRVLGVPIGSDLGTVQSAFEKLARRCDPRRFPENSREQKDAQRILERVNVAFEALRKRLDPTENRFGKLELE
ncbi:MAG: J domain-containing protein [Armatimonadota bacterium]